MSGIVESSSQENKKIAHEILMTTSLRYLARQVIAFSKASVDSNLIQQLKVRNGHNETINMWQKKKSKKICFTRKLKLNSRDYGLSCIRKIFSLQICCLGN